MLVKLYWLLHLHNFDVSQGDIWIERSNGFIERMVGVAKKLMDKSWIRQHCITFATDDTVHSQGKELNPVPQCTWYTRNAPNPLGTYQKTREQ